MNKDFYHKKIVSLVLILSLIAVVVLPTVSYAQRPNYMTEVDSSIGSVNIGDIAADCTAQFIANYLIDNFVDGIMGGISGAISSMGNVPTYDSNVFKEVYKTRANTDAQVEKEGYLDAAAFCVANKVIEQIVMGTIDWINKGLGGNPIFINDPGRYFENIAEYELRKLLGELGLEDLICVNVNVDTIRLNLVKNYTNYRLSIPKCALGTINVNIRAFADGNFTLGGGWDSWHAHVSDPYSNYYGTQLAIMDELNDRTSASQTEAQIELDWNNGYQSIRDDKGNITTPGNLIQSQVEARINAPIGRLNAADELNEVITGLVNNLINIAIGSK